MVKYINFWSFTHCYWKIKWDGKYIPFLNSKVVRLPRDFLVNFKASILLRDYLKDAFQACINSIMASTSSVIVYVILNLFIAGYKSNLFITKCCSIKLICDYSIEFKFVDSLPRGYDDPHILLVEVLENETLPTLFF